MAALIQVKRAPIRQVGQRSLPRVALPSYAKGLSRALAPRGIRANLVSPGTIYFTDGHWGRVEREDPAYFAQMIGYNPLGRMGRPKEIGRVTAFVASPAASVMTGANIVVDGGMTTATPV